MECPASTAANIIYLKDEVINVCKLCLKWNSQTLAVYNVEWHHYKIMHTLVRKKFGDREGDY